MFPLLKRCLSLDSTEVFERYVDVDVRDSIHELDNWDLRFGDAEHIGGNANILESPGGLSQSRIDHAPVSEIHGCWATLVEPIRSIDKIHIRSG